MASYTDYHAQQSQADRYQHLTCNEQFQASEAGLQAANFTVFGITGVLALVDAADLLLHPAERTAANISKLGEAVFDSLLHGVQSCMTRDAPWYLKIAVGGLHVLRGANIAMGLAAEAPPRLLERAAEEVVRFYKGDWVNKIFVMLDHAGTAKNIGDLALHTINALSLTLPPSREG